MRIITKTCSDCGTIVAANELEERRVMKCPSIDCDNALRFDSLPECDREFFLEAREKYVL